MTSKLARAVALALTLSLAACFGPGTPEEQLESIQELQAKNLPMNDEQKSGLAEHVEKGREALAAGNKETAGKEFEAALAILNAAADAALYNKAD